MPPLTPSFTHDTPLEHLADSVERVTFHSEETGFCVLRVKVRGHRDLGTVVGTAPTISPGEFLRATTYDKLSAEFYTVTSHNEWEREGGHDGIPVAL